MSRSFPARLHAILARNATTGVVFRRGPSHQVATFLWDRNGDRFTLGQWMKGKIYERRSDLSPDGRHLIYFAMNGRWKSTVRGSWTAVSRTPYLKAVTLYAKGDCWEGGGLFLGNTTYWLNDRYFSKESIRQQSSKVTRVQNYWPEKRYGSEDAGVYYVRLQRDGWQLVGERGHRLDSATIFEKHLASGITLRKIAHEQIDAPPGKGCYWDEHVVIDAKGREKKYADWEWAEIDGHRIVFCTAGSLFASGTSK